MKLSINAYVKLPSGSIQSLPCLVLGVRGESILAVVATSSEGWERELPAWLSADSPEVEIAGQTMRCAPPTKDEAHRRYQEHKDKGYIGMSFEQYCTYPGFLLGFDFPVRICWLDEKDSPEREEKGPLSLYYIASEVVGEISKPRKTKKQLGRPVRELGETAEAFLQRFHDYQEPESPVVAESRA